jgi:hypothetical protein
LPDSVARAAGSVAGRGTLGNPPARAGGRDSTAAGTAGSGGADGGGCAGALLRWRGCGPGQSQIDRCGSAGCAATLLAGVANAGVRPGAAPSNDEPRTGAGSSGGAAGAAAGAGCGSLPCAAWVSSI